MKINTNVSAINAYTNLGKVQNALQDSMAVRAASIASSMEGPRALDSGGEPGPRCSPPGGSGGMGIKLPLSSSMRNGGRLSAGRLRGDSGLS